MHCVLTPNQKGAIVEAAIAYEATRAGAEVFKPLSEHARADLILGIGSRLFRVQCKSAKRSGDVLRISLAGSRHTPRGYVRSKYTPDEIDLIAAHCLELGRSFLLPFSVAAGERSALHLRLAPPRNGQIAAIHYAKQYELSGAVAQLGERRGGTAKATGSSPVSSIPRGTDDSAVDPAAEEVGAHRFRNLFGCWLERVESGGEVIVTKRGRRVARLTGLAPPPPRP